VTEGLQTSRDPRAAGVGGGRAWRIVAACAAVTLVVVLSGVAPTAEQKFQWVLSNIVGVGAGLAAARWLVPWRWLQHRLLASVLAIAVAATLPIAATVTGCLVLFRHERLTLALVGGVLPSVFATTAVMTGLAFLVRRAPVQTHAAAPGAPPPKFMARLPAKLRGAELYAVEAEDHYLRLHTSLGQDLILMRLADAVAELEGVEGAQTHRSWWVARTAVDRAERFDGRAVLTLKDGAEVPVSRGFARGLRAAGWF
jgi:DNA-binding LytR/AlgR family response regulator